jgi:hypothetical protein
MPDDRGERIAVLERRADLAEAANTGINAKLDAIMSRGARMEADIAIMKPAVAVLRDGLVFVRWGRWLMAGALSLLAWGAGALDWITAHIHFK